MNVAQWSVLFLCFTMAVSIGGGIYEHLVITPIWRRSPPSSFTVIQPVTGVPLQRFWIPVHSAITLALFLAFIFTWHDGYVRRFLLIGLGSYVVMRIWSAFYFIPEMLAFQKISPNDLPSAALSGRVSRWTFWTWFREPLDILSFGCFLLALYHLKK
jgi:hypothetical protein